MLDWNRWLPGLGSDEPEEEESAVAKTLRALGQVPDALGDIGRSAGQSVVGAVQGATQAVQDAYAVPTEQRPPAYSGPSYAQPSLAPGQPSMLEQASNVAAGAGRGLMEGISDAASVADRALVGPTVTAPTWEDPLAPVREVGQHIAAHPTSVLPLGIYSEAQQAATDPIGRRAVEAAGGGTEPLFQATIPESVPLVGGATIAPSAQDVGGFASSAVLDPLNYIGAAGAGLAGKGVRAVAAEGLRGVPLVGESEALLRGGAGLVRRGAGAASDVLGANAEHMATADARMAQEGSTQLPAVFGALPEPSRQRQTVEVLQDQLETATAAWQRARDAGDERMAALAREHAVALESDLVDARNARLELEPAIRSDVGRRVEELPLAEETADTLSGAGARAGAVRPEDLSGPVGIPVDLSGRANASAGALPPGARSDPLAAVNRAIAEPLVGGTAGAVEEQARNPDEDPRTAAARGFAAGAVGFPLATRGARGLARLAGKADDAAGALATVGGLPGDGGAARRARLAAQRAAANPAQIANLAGQAASAPMTGPHTNGQHVTRNVARQIQKQAAAGVPPQVPTGPMPPPDPPPSWWDHVENWRYNLGLFAQLATGMVQAAGGAVQALGGGTAEAIRLGVLKGQPEALLPIAAEGVKAIPGALKSAAMTAAGRVPKAIEAGSDYKPSLHAREFAQGNVGRGVAALAVGTPGRVMTQAPDALWYEMFHKAGIAQAAADEAGRQAGHSPLAMADRLRIQRDLIANPTPEILDEATKLAQNGTYKGEPGRVLGAPKKGTEALGPVGSFFMPIYNTVARIHEQALEYTPGIGMLPLEKIGLAPKNQARPLSRRIAQQAVGASVVLGGLSYAAEGGIRGPGPSNANQAQGMRDEGYTPNTTNVGGYWIPNAWFGPWGPILNEIGAINDARIYDHGDKEWDDLTWEKKAASIIKMSGRAALDYPAFDTAQTITKLFTQPEDALPSFLGEVASQYVPGPLRTKAMAEDPKARTRTRGPDVPFEQRFEETVRQRTGVGREQLPVAQDILGRDVENPRQGWGRALAPNIREEKPDPIISAYQDANLTIGDPPTELSVGALKPGLTAPTLTPEETRRWNTIRGEQIIKSVETLMAGEAWATHDAAWRKSALESRRAAAGEFATGTLRKEIGEPEIRRRMSQKGSTKAAS